MARPRRFARPSLARQRWLQALCAPSLALCLMAGSVPRAEASFAPNQEEVERLYLEGQERVEAKDYKGAADSWTRLLSLLPESGDNQAIRESVIINILDAHIKAYNQLVDDKGTKDIGHLESGKTTLDQYYAEFKGVHGDRVAVSAAVQEKAAELEAALEQAKRDAAAKPPEPDPKGGVPPVEPQPKPDDGPDIVVVNSQNNGNGLIIGGAVVAALGVGALIMIPVGSVRGKTADEDHQAAQADLDSGETTSPAVERALFDGEQANAILISGAVLAPLLLGGAAAMIVFGIKAKRQAKADQDKAMQLNGVAPTFGRGYAGFGLSGRF